MPHADDSKKAARRRRWFQFSLRWLLILSVAFSFPLGYLGWRLHRGRRIQEVARLLHDQGYHLEGYGLPGVFELLWLEGQTLADAHDNKSENGSELLVTEPIETDWREKAGYYPPENDVLWLRGLGPAWLGDSIFARSVKLNEIDSRGDAESIWELVAELPDLEELHLTASTKALLRSKNAVSTLHRLAQLKQLRLTNGISDEFLNAYQPPPSLESLELSNVGEGSGAAWQRFFAKSHIKELHLDKPARPKMMLAAARSLRSLVSVHVTDCTLDDEALKALFSLEPTGSLMITRARIPEGDDRARQRLAAAGLNIEDLYIRGSEWKQFREDHRELLFSDAPQHFVSDQSAAQP
jgi:hypothetical protein